MSLYDYMQSQKLVEDDVPFYAIIMAAMRKADTNNALKLRAAFPKVWRELDERYHAPGGLIGNETEVIDES